MKKKKINDKKTNAIDVDYNMLYRTAIKAFKECKNKDSLTEKYTDLAAKYEIEYGFDFQAVISLLDNAAYHVEMTTKMKAEQVKKAKSLSIDKLGVNS